MYRLIVSIVAPALLAGCQSVGVDISHTKTTAGYVNSSLIDVGHLFLVDTTPGKESVRKLGVIDLTDERKGRKLASFTANGIAGPGFNVGVNAGLQAGIEAELSSGGTVELANAQSVEFQGTYTALAKAINSNGDVIDQWGLRDAATPGSPYRYLLVYGTYYADKASFSLNNTALFNGSLTIPDGRGGTARVNLKGADSEAFTGDAVPVLVNYYLLKAYIATNENGVESFHFVQDLNFDLKRLPDILRR